MHRRLYGSSLGAQEEEKVPSYEFVCSTREVPEHKAEIQDYTYDGAKPAHLGRRPKNVILFGETGVGKSSVINLMAGEEVAKTSSNLEGCTLDATKPEMGVNTFLGAIVKAHQLVASLHSAGGVDLLLFCIRAGRITTAMQRSYHMFFEILCGGQVPLAIVVTNLEQEDVMEDWWVKNEETFQQYDIRSVAHACITAVPARVTVYAQKRAESQKALRIMMLDTLGNPNSSYVQETQSWFVAIVKLLRSFLTKKASPKKKDLLRRLETKCMLPRSDAQKLAEMLTGSHN